MPVPGAWPWSQEPISSIPEAEDPSTPNPLTALLSDPTAQFQFLVKFTGYDPILAARRDVFISSAGYATLGDNGGVHEGVPNHQAFPNALVSPYSMKVNLIPGGAWQASAIPGFGAVVIANPDRKWDFVQLMDVEGERVLAWVGPRRWIGPTFGEFGRVMHGRIDSLTWDTDTITLNVRDLRQLLEDADANPDVFLGFDVAVRTRAVADKVTVPHSTAFHPVDGSSNPLLDVEVIVNMDAPLRTATVMRKGVAYKGIVFSNGAVGLFINLTGAIPARWVISKPGLVTPGETHRVGFRGGFGALAYGQLDGMAVYVDGVYVAGSSTTTFDPVSNTSALIFGAAS